MKFSPGKVMDECGEMSQRSFFIRGNTHPEWRLDAGKIPYSVEIEDSIEAPGVTITIQNRAYYVQISLSPTDAVTWGEALAAKGKAAIPHTYGSWVEKSLLEDAEKALPMVVKKQKEELITKYLQMEEPVKFHQAEQFPLPFKESK